MPRPPRLRRLARSGVAAAAILSLTAPMALGAGPALAAPQLEVRGAQAATFSRIEFRWAGGARMTTRREGRQFILRFSRDAKPDLSQLKVLPPKWLESVEARHTGSALEIVLTLAEGADARAGEADGAHYVNIFDAAAAPAAPAATQVAAEPEPSRPNPIPAGGAVRVSAEMSGPQLRLKFPWAAPNGAAVFRRGDAVWIVFDAPARIDVSQAPRGLRQASRFEPSQGADYAALRMRVPRDLNISASSEGATWVLAIGPGAGGPVEDIKISRADVEGPPSISAAVAGATRVVWVADPNVGDRLAVVTALAPAKGMAARRGYVNMALLPSAQGLAAEVYSTDVDVSRAGDLVNIGRPSGLTLSPAAAGMEQRTAALGAPQPAPMPALIDEEGWSKLGPGGFLERYDQLLDAAADEVAKGDAAPVTARMALARFLVGMELPQEAIGVLNAAQRSRQSLAGDPEFRGLRGMARVMAGRPKEAAADFSVPILSGDPSAALWRGYIAAETGDWAEARRTFQEGALAFELAPAKWRARFARADALAALKQGDLPAAKSRIRVAVDQKVAADEGLENRLVQAQIFEAEGDKARALKMYDAIGRAPVDAVATPAQLYATRIRYAGGQLDAAKTAAVYDGLRYRWRGDATELETIRALGQLYLSQGRYREALEALRSAGLRLPDLPEAVQLQADLTGAFRSLFLDGMADGLQPIQALALFYDFQELTPIGADGDMMVRKLVRRLVDVDLLDQAGGLLKYQVDNRLDGVPKAQVATDLAIIYLMDRQPESALQAINNTRSTLLPGALQAERRAVTARALIGLGRLDAAEEFLGADKTAEAQDIRCEIAWKQKKWALAGQRFEAVLGDRWKNPLPLSAMDEGRLLRAGIGYSLSGDEAALTRLRTRYSGFVEAARAPDALRVALAGVEDEPLRVADFARSTADNQLFAGWIAKMKARFREAPAGAPPARTAEATPGAGAG